MGEDGRRWGEPGDQIYEGFLVYDDKTYRRPADCNKEIPKNDIVLKLVEGSRSCLN